MCHFHTQMVWSDRPWVEEAVARHVLIQKKQKHLKDVFLDWCAYLTLGVCSRIFTTLAAVELLGEAIFVAASSRDIYEL